VKAIIPVKALSEGKTRLAQILGAPAREALNIEFLDRALAITAIFPGAADTIVISADARVREIATARGATALAETGEGLNAALDEAAARARADGAEAILVTPVDLPRATAEDLLALASTGSGFAIAPDRKGRGTNGLYLAFNGGFVFRFGEDSLSAHLKEARAHGAEAFILDAPNLAFDIDTPDDYRDWRDGEA